MHPTKIKNRAVFEILKRAIDYSQFSNTGLPSEKNWEKMANFPYNCNKVVTLPLIAFSVESLGFLKKK